ncbi:MAG: hypothetical protein ACREIB_00225 [Pseudomonadota bacterium]
MALPSWWPLLLALLALAGGALAGWELKPAPPARFETVVVKDTNLAQLRPHVTPTLGERITKTTVKPSQVATSAGKADSTAINNFCAQRVAAVVRARAKAAALQTSAQPEADSLKPAVSTPAPILPPFSGRFADNTLTLQATRSDGSLYQAEFAAHPPLEWVAGHGGQSDTAAIVRQNRALFRLLPKLGKCAKGGLMGGAIGAGAGLLTGIDVGKAAAIAASAGCAGAQF